MVEELPTRLRSLLGEDSQETHLLGSSSWMALIPFFSCAQVSASLSRPQLILVPDESHMEPFAKAIQFFNPDVEVHFLRSFDISPYLHQDPHRRMICERVNWLYRAQNATPGDIFLASLRSLSQRTLPVEDLFEYTHAFRVGDELPSNFSLLMDRYGYHSVSYVEDPGSYCQRGGIVDIYSPAHKYPLRLELFGDIVESARHFDPYSQRSFESIKDFVIIPTKEIIFTDENRQMAAQSLKAHSLNQKLDSKMDEAEIMPLLHSMSQGIYFRGVEFYLPYFYKPCAQPLQHFLQDIDFWMINPVDITQKFDAQMKELKEDWESATTLIPSPQKLFVEFEDFMLPPSSRKIHVSKVGIYNLQSSSPQDKSPQKDNTKSRSPQNGSLQDQSMLSPSSHREVDYRTQEVNDFISLCKAALGNYRRIGQIVQEKISDWSHQGYKIFISSTSQTLFRRFEQILKDNSVNYKLTHRDDYSWQKWLEEQSLQGGVQVHIVPRKLGVSLKFVEEKIIFIQDKDIFGHYRSRISRSDSERVQEKTKALNFGDLAPGDLIVHKLHGVGIFRGLSVMPIGGVKSEFIQLEYKDKDKLYLPIYRIGQIQRYSGPLSTRLMDKLGGTQWAKVQTKAKKYIRDMTAELLHMYAKRTHMKRPSFDEPHSDYFKFEDSFPFEETEDQMKAIGEVLLDLTKDNPMDRLICGDVGFGKTEVAMRAAFHVAYGGKQVALLAPTTILTMQHFENFKRRFKGWPMEIRLLNRFVDKKKIKETLLEMEEGRADIIIGTHRLLSKDIKFKRLGLLVIDEEQKFGVRHKEKIRKIKAAVDTMALSATPIPRTLNMSLVGIRDLSLISTPPVDRLPIRTFVSHHDMQTIKKAIENEIARGGQTFFLHNRIQSIDFVASELRELMPGVRFAVGHGQMEESQLEQVMIDFLNHNTDVLICTTIIESGMDIPRSNTMFINEAQNFGLSQLYQLRGRIGRSKERGYCYLLIPRNRALDDKSQEKLRILQENSALGSGIRIAQHDLEIRGTGDFLGESQSGHIHSIGYEHYMELLEEAMREQKGESPKEESIEPEINISIPAYIPDKYIPDIRIRLAYYKILSQIKGPQDIDTIEADLQDQFGKIPNETLNLMGIMLIRRECKELRVEDISSGKNTITMKFMESTRLSPEKVVELTLRESKKYSITPDHRLKIRMDDIQWPRIHSEVSHLKTLLE